MPLTFQTQDVSKLTAFLNQITCVYFSAYTSDYTTPSITIAVITHSLYCISKIFNEHYTCQAGIGKGLNWHLPV